MQRIGTARRVDLRLTLGGLYVREREIPALEQRSPLTCATVP